MKNLPSVLPFSKGFFTAGGCDRESRGERKKESRGERKMRETEENGRKKRKKKELRRTPILLCT